ncbi:MAG: hypothetical protein CL607_17740 [Anaerolineaceae bacterium]|nr:hypothetical protein [Anaerolineaceae bacterium]
MTQSAEHPWSDERLDAFRQVGDQAADAVIAHVLDVHDVATINQMMRSLVRNVDLPLADLPEIVRDYLDETFMLPMWTRPDLLRRASAFFDLHGPEIVMLLFAASLPVLYAKQRGAPVLTITRKLNDATTIERRIVETGQFLLDVTDSEGFTHSGRGIRTVQKVRLMHAAVRHYIAHDAAWNALWQPEWGVPINQTDLAGTMLSFSVTVIDGLEKAGIRVGQVDKEAYLHLWKLIGHIMGIVPELLPDDYASAKTMMTRWMSRDYGTSEAGVFLTKTLRDFMYARVPGRVFDSYTTNWMRYWLGHDLADALQVPPHDGGLVLVHLTRGLWALQGRVRALSPIVEWSTRFLIRRLLTALIERERDGKDVHFSIPERLKAQWAVRG